MDRLGTYDTPITIEQKVVTYDPVYGTDVVTWSSLTSGSRIMAEVRDVLPSRSEAVAQNLEVAKNQVRIRMPYRSDVTAAMRITAHRVPDVVYQIVGGPAMIGRREAMEMVCERYSS